MKNIFYLAGGLLLLNGVLHFGKLAAYGIDPNAVIPAVMLAIFGLAYLVIGTSLLRSRDSALLWAVIVPGIGLLLSLLGSGRDGFSIAFMIIDALVVAMCGYVLVVGRGKLGRVR